MSTVPNTFASTSIFKGDITTQDFLHLVRESDGSILGWLDENGIPQGSMAIGGGGGGSSIFIEGTPVSNPDFLAGPGVAFAISGSNVTLSNTGVLSLNSQTGALTAVLSLNSLIGALNITAGSGIGVTPSGTSIAIVNQGVRSLNSLTGTPSITGGTGLSVTPSGAAIALANTGVTSISAGQGITVSAATGSVAIGSTAAQLPWVDIQAYGGIPKPESIINATTSVNTTGGLPNITVGSALLYFQNGAGVCIWKAGAATSQSTPSAPTVTSPAVSGSQTITYQIVGVDAFGGLTTASLAGAVTSAPAIFNPSASVISSITASAGVVTVNFSAPLNNTVLAGMTIHIVGVTGAGANWNGIWTIASAPTTSQITYALSGATGTGTVSSASTGRVSNTQILTAISRSSTGVITASTAENHNFQVGSGTKPTIVIIENVFPLDLNGHYVIASTPTATSFTINTGNLVAETGVLNLNNGTIAGAPASCSTATVWEYNYIACPTLSGTTIGYYIYSDNANPGGALALIGKTLYGEHHFTDWGPYYGGGFKAPAYVPTTPPVAPQNQMFSSTILSGGGTTSMILAANVPSSVAGGTIMYDDGPCLLAASTALPSLGGQIILSPPATVGSVSLPMYIINSPTTMPQQRELLIASGMYMNETLTMSSFSKLTGSLAAAYTLEAAFSGLANPILFGLASPMVQFGTLAHVGLGLTVENLGISCTVGGINGQYGISFFQAYYSKLSNISLVSTNGLAGGTNVPLVFNGNTVGIELDRITFDGSSVYGDEQPIGQSCFGPCVGNILICASDNTAATSGFPPAQFYFTGPNTCLGRGILIDGQFFEEGTSDFIFGDQIWNQAPTTPTIMCVGCSSINNIVIRGVLNDSESPAIIANLSPQLNCVTVSNCETDGNGVPLVTGNYINGLVIEGAESTFVGQTLNTNSSYYGTANIGSVVLSPPKQALNIQSIAQSLGPTGVIFAPLANLAVTATTSGVGTFAAGTYNVSITFVGWEGGESQPYPINQPALVTVNGSQGIEVSWTPPSGVQGSYIYINDHRNNTLYTTSPQTFTSLGADTSAIPTFDGTGLPLINANLVIVPELILPSGVNKLTLQAPALSGNRSVTLADGAQSTVVATSLTTTLNGSPYTIALQGATSNSHYSITPTNAAAAADLATGGVYVSTKSTNQIIVVTGATAGETFDILGTVN